MNQRATVSDPLLEWRAEFPTVEATLHFASHTLGAMPRGVEEQLRQYAQQWKSRGIRAWEEGWFTLPTETADVLGSILHAPPGTIAMCENDTVAQAIAFSAVSFAAPRNRVVCTREDFHSQLYLYEELTRRGAELVRVGAGPTGGDQRPGQVTAADVVDAIDERTAVVAVSHVFFRSGQILDLEPIVRRAHEAGAIVIVDGYQAVGTVPVDVQALGLDVLTGGSVKWLCGGPGAGWLYVSAPLAPTFEPALTGWFAHENPFAFDTGPMRRDPGARRYFTGTPGIPSFAAARPGYEIIARIGVAAIREKSLRQTARMIQLADEYGFPLVSPRAAAERGGTVCLDVPHAERVCRALLAGDVLLDFRPGVGLRLAPHFYTRDDEVEIVMKRVRDESRRAAV